MPKHSKSRSRDSDRKSKKSHKHKDKKKHKKYSRSRDRDNGKDYRNDSKNVRLDPERERSNYRDEQNNGNGSSRREPSRDYRDNRDNRDNREYRDHRENDHNNYSNREENKHRSTSRFDEKDQSNDQQVNTLPKKSSRFSDMRKIFYHQHTIALAPPQNNLTQSKSQMPPPSGVPAKRRKFVWTDADEHELLEQQMKEKRSGIDENSPALMIGSNSSLFQNLNPAILSALQDSSKIKKKIYLPKNTGINYIGLLIGPRGLYQKRLEEESGCKILIRGKGSQKEGSAPQPDDDDEQHVLIIGDSSESVRRAQNAIERVISADEGTRNKIREEQLVVAQQINNSILPNNQMDDSMMTPYGPPSPYAYIIPVPNDCVGLIIGKGGDTIRQLQMESGAKIQVAKKEIPNSNLRNVFVEGPPDKYQRAKEMIEEIIREHRRTADPQINVGDVNPFPGPHSKVKVPDKFVGLIIGKNGENLRGIAQRSNTKIFVPQKNNDPGAEERIVEVDGEPANVEIARQEIFALIQRYMSQSGSSTYDFSKNPYGSGIAVYNQQKLASDGQAINGAVPDALKPESGSYASNLLTENPMLAYNAMQLTGWSYDYPQAEGQEGQPAQYQQPTGDQQYQQDYDAQYYYGNYQYDPQYQEYYNQYYQGGGQYPPATGEGQPADQRQNAETQPQPSTDTTGTENQAQAQAAQNYQDPYYGAGGAYGYDYNQYYQNYYNYGQPGGPVDPNAAAAYYQQYGYQMPAEGGQQEGQQNEEQKQEPAQ